ncbi:DUF1349 domain-containing protein [Actinophytocola sediminis]
MTTGWSWLNEPATWALAGDTLTVTADAGSDFWRTTHYGFVRHSGHVFGGELVSDFLLTATFAGDYRDQYDQAGVMLHVDETNWIKSGIELVDGHQQVSAVVTREFSDWSVAPVDAPQRVTIEIARVGDTATIRYGLDGADPTTMLRLAYLPPDVPVLAGVMAAAPDGQGFTTTFTDIALTQL